MDIMNAKRILTIITLLFILSCIDLFHRRKPGRLPDNPINLEDFNTKYDDYNSADPQIGKRVPFCFSSNRKSGGYSFDITYQQMGIFFNTYSGELSVTKSNSNYNGYPDYYEKIQNVVDNINSAGNELGPYLLYDYNYKFDDADFVLLYATDLTGNFEINYTFNNDISDFSEYKPVKYLNSEYNDLYPAFDADFTKIYFCSDRENGKFDVFYVNINNTSKEIIKELSDSSSHEVYKDVNISSDYDDKCPYIFDNMLVFSSNRPGGFGGFDLYYSIFKNGKWSSPENIGAHINTEFDEYRPIIFEEGVDEARYMMVFSSDRPGGKGGFDLYFVGVGKNF
jgi:hypothetical protein